MFFLAPLFLIALLAWVDRGAPRPRPAVIVAAVGLGVLPALIPYERFLDTGVKSDTLMLLPIWELQDRTGLPRVDEIVLVVGLVIAAVFLLLPRRYALALPLAVLVYFALAFPAIQLGQPNGLEQAAIGARLQGLWATDDDWIDRAVPDGAEVALVWTGRTDRFTVNLNEFFSKSVGPIYVTDLAVPGSLPETRVELDPETGRFIPPVRARYVVVDSTITPDGEVLARDDGTGMTLWRLDGDLVSTTSVTGLYPNDTWSGSEVTWRRLRCDGGTLAVALDSDPSLFDVPQRVTGTSIGRRGNRALGKAVSTRVEPTEAATLRLPLIPDDGVCRVRFTVSPTRVPGNGDDRELGVHFRSFDYREP